jgi:CBS domain-containing protein
MCENACGAIPVVEGPDGRVLVGIVTSRDITCRVLASGKSPTETTARDCMSSPVVTLAPDATVDDCCRAMERSGVRRIPVLDAGGACTGIVSLDDVAYWAPNQATASLIRAVMPLSRSAPPPDAVP